MTASLNVDLRWVPVELVSGTAYRFPRSVTPRMKVLYEKPFVYRWVVYSPEQKLRGIYFGETENLAKRIGQYLAPGKDQVTNQRLKGLFEQQLKRQSTIGIETLDFGAFRINSIDFDLASLRYSYIREALESLVLADFCQQDHPEECYILNRTTSASEKQRNDLVRQVRKALKDMPPAERQEILKRAQT